MIATRQLPRAVLVLVAATPIVFAWACRPKSSDATPANVEHVTGDPSASSASVTSVVAAPIQGPSASPADASASIDCDHLFKAMQVGADAVLRKHSACTTDADCVTVSSRVCIGACDTAIHRAGVAEHERAEKAAQPQCDAFMKSSCIRTYPIAVPTCPMMIAKCANGACKAQWQ